MFIKPHHSSALLLSGLLSLCGCGEETPSSSNPDQALSGADLERAQEDFLGTYALSVMTTSEQELPVVGLARSTSRAAKLLTITEREGRFFTEERFCRITMETEGPATPSAPEALVNSIPTMQSELKLKREDNSWTWERTRSAIALGVRLDQPSEDSLPESADDERIWDQDEDGNPGVTLEVSGLIEGALYVVIRYADTLSGELSDDGELIGEARDETEQVVVGASSEVLRINVSATPVNDPELNKVMAFRLTADADCDAVISEIDARLPTNTPDN